MTAGLEVGDQVIRLVYYNGKVWQMYATRMEPGVMENGRIKDRAAVLAAIRDLKEKAQGKKAAKKMNVVLCLSSVESYTQPFSLPLAKDENIDEAVSLNLQMASPLAAEESYSGWQIVERDEKSFQMHILSAFIDRKVVDEMVDVLYEAGLLVMAVESRALALSRMLREKAAGMGAGKAYVFVDIDNEGIDFLIIRNGTLYFEYAVPWRNIMDEKGEVTAAAFETVFAGSMRQVVNFYNQHWADEPLTAIILSAIALEVNAEKVIAEVAPTVSSVRLTLVMGQPVSSEWLTALGCSLRDDRDEKSHEISLLGEDSEDRFRAERFLHFLRFWRTAVPVALSFLILIFVGANILLLKAEGNTVSAGSGAGGAETSQVATLEAQVGNFNQLVGLLAAAESSAPKSALLSLLADLAAKNEVTVNHMVFQSFTAPISLSGTAPAQDAAVAFKTALTADPHVSAVNLPLTGIQTNGSSVTFSMTFLYTPSAASSTPVAPASAPSAQ